jgi:hypothetical protein
MCKEINEHHAREILANHHFGTLFSYLLPEIHSKRICPSYQRERTGGKESILLARAERLSLEVR